MYRVEIWQDGVLLLTRQFEALKEARIFYRQFFFRGNCGVELYQDGERLRYKEAWSLMLRGLRQMNYQNRRRFCGQAEADKKTDH